MARPKAHNKPRTTTAVRFSGDLLDRMKAAAAERDLSVNFLVERACEDFLARLIPLNEMVWTRERSEAPFSRAAADLPVQGEPGA